MENFNRKNHWEKVYSTKQLDEVSWYQPRPHTSLFFVSEFSIPLNAKIIDVGGGDSLLVDHLLDLGYTNITVLDISETSLTRAKQRLGDKGKLVKWIVADAATFVPTEKYDFWHDRAAFHFLTNENEVEHYISAIKTGLAENGVLVIGTFSENGPQKCSGIDIKQYSELDLTSLFQHAFKKIK
jgi:SAM-dependent methyltransferase